MSKQGEIDRLLNLWADDHCLFVEKTCEHRGMYYYCCSEGEALKCLKERLGEQGVVIKVDKNRLPDISYHSAYPENEEMYQQAMLKAGYVAVEPLIKE